MTPPASGGAWARCLVVAGLLAPAASSGAETGYDLWLRYRPLTDPALIRSYRQSVTAIVAPKRSPTNDIAVAELRRGLSGLLGVDVPTVDEVKAAGAVVIGTPSSSQAIAGLGWTERLAPLGDEGYVIRSTSLTGHPATVIASSGEVGALYGAFHLLRLIQTGQPLASLDIAERPRLERRLLNHWDNLDGSVERGYAGRSRWSWSELPGRVDPRIADYARANASIGINGAVLNNVNAKAESLSGPYLDKTAALARTLRPYGIRVYLSANFAAPKLLGGLPTADPLDPKVAAWWREKAAEIYRLIPDFGGFVVKANSEGQPGPQDYGRTHADGANVLADAVAPQGGVVMWRAFVYDAGVDPDRVKRAYLEFVPLDGRFRGNVFAQVKNGPLDFQPREPFHPLFGAMPKTPLLAELQITQEYLGQSNHRADASGIGYDRTRRGSGAVDQYRSPLRELWSDPATCPEALLLWFHRLPWDHKLRSGRTLWEELVQDYSRGAGEARGLEARWRTLEGKVDEERYQAVLAKLRRQAEDAAAWRDKCLRYFQAFSKAPLPGVPPGPQWVR